MILLRIFLVSFYDTRNMRLVILFGMLLNPRFKMTTSFINIARTTASTSKFIY